jgi:cbb3-type cytochrome oxidase maturation protein
MAIYMLMMFLGVGIFVCLLVLLIWAIQSGQYDDLSAPAHRMLWDDSRLDHVPAAKITHPPTNAATTAVPTGKKKE